MTHSVGHSRTSHQPQASQATKTWRGLYPFALKIIRDWTGFTPYTVKLSADRITDACHNIGLTHGAVGFLNETVAKHPNMTTYICAGGAVVTAIFDNTRGITIVFVASGFGFKIYNKAYAFCSGLMQAKDEFEAQVGAFQSENEGLKAEVVVLKDTNGKLEQTIVSLERQVELLEGTREALKGDVETLQGEIGTLKPELTAATTACVALKEQIAKYSDFDTVLERRDATLDRTMKAHLEREEAAKARLKETEEALTAKLAQLEKVTRDLESINKRMSGTADRLEAASPTKKKKKSSNVDK